MDFKLDSRTPVYMQVMQYFKAEIASGALKTGQEIPSRRELAAKLKINPNTVQRAYKEMEAVGLIFTDGNMPSKVTKDVEVIRQVRQDLLCHALDEFMQTVKTLHIPLEELIPLMEERLQGKGRQ